MPCNQQCKKLQPQPNSRKEADEAPQAVIHFQNHQTLWTPVFPQLTLALFAHSLFTETGTILSNEAFFHHVWIIHWSL